MRLHPPAKVNLFLEVGARREDGYHDLDTVFAAVDLCDELDVEACGGGEIRLEVDGGEVPDGPGNLVWVAAEKLRRAAGVRAGARLRLRKRIPAGAGLGGGSSDAASTLIALNRVWGLDFPLAKLAAVGMQVGSDVPFFLHGGLARGRGRGERLTPVPGRLPLLVVLVPPWRLATAAVYGALRPGDLTGDRRDANLTLQSLLEEDGTAALGRAMFNRLEAAARRIEPRMESFLAAFSRTAPHGACMSGSGTALWSPVGSEAEGEALLDQANGFDVAGWVVRSAGRVG